MRALQLFASVVTTSAAFTPLTSTLIKRCSQLEMTDKTAKQNVLADKATQEWDVTRYQDQHSFVWQFGSPLVEILDPKPGERILDVGCGSGELTFAIAEFSFEGSKVEVVGMDSDLSMVQKAQEQYPQISFFQGDVRSLVVSEPYDAIFSNAALHWVPSTDVVRSVEAMSRALKDGGRFVVEFGGRGNVQHVVSAIQEVMPGTKSPWYFPGIPEYAGILESHGIEVVSASLFDRPTMLKFGEEGMKNWVRMFGSSFFDGKSPDESKVALDQIQAKLRPFLFDGSQWTADYRRIRIVGRKVTAT